MKRFLMISAFLAACTVGCGMAVGEKAVEKMNADEKAYMSEILMKIQPDASETDLVKVLGEPHRGAGTLRPVWLAPGNSEKSQVAFYILDGRIIKIRWMRIGVFLWEREL